MATVVEKKVDNSVYINVNRVIVDEDAKTRYSTSLKLDTLIQELKEKGAHVAFGYIGPKCYNSDPFLAGSFQGVDVYGFKPGTRAETGARIHVLVVGASKEEDKEYVYYKLSFDRTINQRTYIREHQTGSDDRLFVASHKTFKENLVDLYPPVAKEKTHPNFISEGSANCTEIEIEYILKLIAIPLDSILGDHEAACKAIGQELFDKCSSTQRSKETVKKVCEALAHCAKDGKLRKQYVEYAWEGIGNDDWRWHR